MDLLVLERGRLCIERCVWVLCNHILPTGLDWVGFRLAGLVSSECLVGGDI